MADDLHLTVLHKHSSFHRDEVLRSELCGCFACTQRIRPARILEWTDGGQTANCPYCGIDAVLPDNIPDYPLTAELLNAMRLKWFNGYL